MKHTRWTSARWGPHLLFPRDQDRSAGPYGPATAGSAAARAPASLGTRDPCAPRALRAPAAPLATHELTQGAGRGAGLGPPRPAVVGVAQWKPRPSPAHRHVTPPLPRLRGRAPDPLQPPRILCPQPAPAPLRCAPGSRLGPPGSRLRS